MQAILRKHNGSAAQIRRARCVLLWAEGEHRVDIRNKLACNDAFVTHWVRAYQQQGANGLVSHYPGRAPTRCVTRMEAKVLNRTPKDGSMNNQLYVYLIPRTERGTKLNHRPKGLRLNGPFKTHHLDIKTQYPDNGPPRVRDLTERERERVAQEAREAGREEDQ